MKNRILTKLRSRTGASITFALLLFLVCAVLASVILVAASAAAGRMSGIAEADQRYYAVTSAAELLRDLLEDHPASVVVIKDDNSPLGKNVYLADDPASAIVRVDDGWTNISGSYDKGKAIQRDAAYAAYEAFWGASETPPDPTSALRWTLSSNITSGTKDPLSVTVNGSVTYVEGVGHKLTLAVTKESYSMVLSFVSDKTPETKALAGLDAAKQAWILTPAWKLTEIKTAN